MSSEMVFRMSLGALVLALAVVRFRAIGWATMGRLGADDRTSLERSGRISYNILLFVGWLWLLAPIMYVLAPRWLDWAALPMPNLVRWIGVGLGVSSIILLAWAHRALGRNWSVPGVVQEHQVLVTDGPYRWMRHPMYTAFAVIALAYWLISTNWFIALSGFAYWTMVFTMVDAEEGTLTEEFGEEYRKYRRCTGRFWPSWHRGG